MAEDALKKMAAQIAELDAKIGLLVADRHFDSRTPLGLREAADACHVDLNWLRTRVARKEIPAYRNREGTPWNVFPADIRAFLMKDSNVKPARRESVIRMTRAASARK